MYLNKTLLVLSFTPVSPLVYTIKTRGVVVVFFFFFPVSQWKKTFLDRNLTNRNFCALTFFLEFQGWRTTKEKSAAKFKMENQIGSSNHKQVRRGKHRNDQAYLGVWKSFSGICISPLITIYTRENQK